MRSLKLALMGAVALCGYFQPAFSQYCHYHGVENNPACTGILANQRQQAANQNAANQAANNAEAQRQWQIREDAVLADIAKERATPAYGALAISDTDSSMGGGLGYKSREVAIQHALAACKKGNCRILITFSNTCAAVAGSYDNLDAKTVVVATDPDKLTALTKALRLCESKFGKNNCGMLNNAKPFCAGYDYGLYGK